MRNQVLSLEITKGVLEFHQLDEQIMFGIQSCSMHRTLEVKTQPFLYTAHSATLSKIQEQHRIQNDRRCQYAVAAQEINLDLHGIAEPSVDVDVVPSFFVIPARGIVVDTHLVREFLVKVRIKLRLKNLLQNRKLALLFRLEGLRVVENLAVTITEDIRLEPSAQTQHSGFQSRGQNGLHQSLSRLEVPAADRHAFFLRQLRQRRDVYRQIRGSVSKRDAFA